MIWGGIWLQILVSQTKIAQFANWVRRFMTTALSVVQNKCCNSRKLFYFKHLLFQFIQTIFDSFLLLSHFKSKKIQINAVTVITMKMTSLLTVLLHTQKFFRRKRFFFRKKCFITHRQHTACTI